MLRNPVLWACVLATACAFPGAEPQGPWRVWESAHDRDHPLVGRVIDVQARREISPAALLRQLAAARYALLGEQHDNPDHHRLQAWLIEGLARAGQRRGVAFEMLPLDLSEALAAALAAHPGDVDAIPAAVGWERLGWPAWPVYRPVFRAALAAGFPIRAADLSRATLAGLRAGGSPPEGLVAMGLDQPLPPGALDRMREDLIRSHCGALPATAVDRLAGIQRARDAQLAASLAAAAGKDGAVLIAGAGHVGRGSGVPLYLARAEPGAPVRSLSLREVDPDVRDLEGELDRAGDFDFLWLTPRVDDSDPCERFREQLNKIHSGRNQPARPESAGGGHIPESGP